MSDAGRDRIGDILAIVQETQKDVRELREDHKAMRKTVYGNGSMGLVESVRIVTKIVDGHMNEHDNRAASARAIRNGAVNRALNIVERAVPWAALLGLLFTR